MAGALNISLQRNESYLRRWALTEVNGAPLTGLSDCKFDLHIKSKLDDTTVIATGAVTLEDADNGILQVFIPASQQAPLHSYGNPLQVANLLYDLLVTYSDGVREALVSGAIILKRGVTYA